MAQGNRKREEGGVGQLILLVLFVLFVLLVFIKAFLILIGLIY